VSMVDRNVSHSSWRWVVSVSLIILIFAFSLRLIIGSLDCCHARRSLFFVFISWTISIGRLVWLSRFGRTKELVTTDDWMLVVRCSMVLSMLSVVFIGKLIDAIWFSSVGV